MQSNKDKQKNNRQYSSIHITVF
uniref:Uncharacterized protein n=1 Tax=Anguilla anguilla TaxID=7936 RepID=A0A0E9QUZ7_ANGAN